MIVCSCNLITRRDIEGVIDGILADDPYAVLTPGLIYHRLKKRGRCCGCFPQVSRILVEHSMEIRAQLEDGVLDAEELREAEEEGEAVYLRAVGAD